MRPGDRAWIVAGLELSGEAAERTAERMGCSLRLIRSLRAEDITQMAKLLKTETAQLEGDLRAEQSEHALTRRELAEMGRAYERVQMQLDQIVDKLAIGEPIATCYRNHPLIGDNVYRHANRDYCRECNRENTLAYRKRKSAEQQRHSIRMTATA